MGYSNHTVAHLWANQSKDSAKSNNGNFWFAGGDIYSYQTCIARLVTSERTGETIALRTSGKFSVTTTGKHETAISRALGYGKAQVVSMVFYVPWLGAGMSTYINHEINYKYLVKVYREEVERLSRRRDPPSEYDREKLNRLATDAHDYAMTFPLPASVEYVELFAETDFLAIRTAHAERLARNSTPAAIARRERERVARIERKERKDAETRRLAAMKAEERLAEWRAGNRDVGVYGLPRGRDGSAYLRVVGDNVETSLGATVPLAHAIRVFRFVKSCREAGKEWKANGHSIAVGHYHVTRIEPSGDFVAGCHFLAWEEIERLARSIGIFEESANV